MREEGKGNKRGNKKRERENKRRKIKVHDEKPKTPNETRP